MAKLGVAYGLCPLIDSNSLLGVNVDSIPDCVIVTIGKNIVIRYKFQDQKQVSSWSSKDRLTSPVVYNSHTSQYSAIFNHDHLRMWDEDDQLDKVKKYKFQEPLHCVISDPDGDCAYILYRCGRVTSLTQALESRKDTLSNSILKNSDTIKEQTIVSCNGIKSIAFTSCNDKDEMCLNIVPVVSGAPSAQYPLLWDKEYTIMGHTIMSKDSSCFLFTLWSDGSLFSFRFLPVVDDDFPGTFIQKVTSVSSKHPVAVTPISNSHLAFFGADSSEEGATLVLLNLEFQLIQSRLHFKLYTKPPRLWNVSGHLLVAVGNNLIAVPYHLEVEQLSTLLGTHSSSAPMIETCWTNTDLRNLDPIDKHAPKNLVQNIKRLRQEGWSQAVILQNILPDIFEQEDFKSLLWCLKKFSDIPESCLVEILKFCFSESDTPSAKSRSTAARKTVPESDNSKISNVRTGSSFGESEERTVLIDAVLNVSVSDVCIMPHLRGLPFTIILSLLEHLNGLMGQESSVPPIRLMEWICLLLDSHYQEYLLSNNEQVLLLLSKLSNEVLSQIECLEELKKLTPLLRKLQGGKVPLKLSDASDKKYSIETLQLY